MLSLVIRPIPKENEHILGYVFRVLNENYIHDAYGFLSQFTKGKSLRSCLSNFLSKDFDLNLFCSYVGKDHIEILSLYDNDFTEIPLANIPTICSFCYQEIGFINKYWTSPLNIICEKHLVFLTNKCLECGHVFEWRNIQFHTCKNCHKPIVSSKISSLVISKSPYLDYLLNKKQLFSISEQQILSVISFFLLLTHGYTLYATDSKFYRKHDFLQEKILASYDNALNFFLENNLFESFLIEYHENQPQSLDSLYTCFTSINDFINDREIRLKLLTTIKKCFFLKTKVSKQTYRNLKSILDINSNYHNNKINHTNINRELFNLVSLFHFKYITKTNKETLILLIEHSFIKVIKNKQGQYKYISIESVHNLMVCQKNLSISLIGYDPSSIKKFIDLDKEQKLDFLYFVVNGVGKSYQYEYDVLKGINETKILIDE